MVALAIAGLAGRLAVGAAASDIADGRRRSLQSSWITEARWADGTTTLVMNGKDYDFPDPDGSIFDGITSASSPGRYYNQRLKR